VGGSWILVRETWWKLGVFGAHQDPRVNLVRTQIQEAATLGEAWCVPASCILVRECVSA